MYIATRILINLWYKKNKMRHNPHSPLLIGDVEPNDIIKERKIQSFKMNLLF